MEMLTKENEKFHEESIKAIKASEHTIFETTAKVEKLSQEVRNFMVEFRTSSDSNTEFVNKVIARFCNFLQAEKEELYVVRSTIKVDNVDLNASVLSKIETLQKDLVAENNIMGQLAEKTQKAKVLSIKLQYTNKRVVDLESKKIVVKSCVFKINQYM